MRHVTYFLVFVMVALMVLLGSTATSGQIAFPTVESTVKPTATPTPTPIPKDTDVVDSYVYTDKDGKWLVEQLYGGIVSTKLINPSAYWIARQEPVPTAPPSFDCEAKVVELEKRIAELEKRLGIK